MAEERPFGGGAFGDAPFGPGLPGLLDFHYVGAGGAVLGGSAVYSILRKIVGAGGAVLGGAADVFPTFAFTGSGGIGFRGFAWVSRAQAPDNWIDADWS